MGYYCSKTHLDDKLVTWQYFIVSSLILLSMLLTGMKFGLQASMIGNQSLLFPIAFISGIIAINGIAHRINNTRLGYMFGFIGDFSFSIMALHFIGFKFVTWGRTYIDSSVNLAAFPVDRTNIEFWMPIYLIVGIALPIAISKLYDNIKYAWYNNCSIQKSWKNS